MSSFPPLTEADLSRARTDPAFRQKLLQQSLNSPRQAAEGTPNAQFRRCQAGTDA
jgi:hypothetical protein